jgi:flagellar basal-body rod modification protein FlgD
MNPVGGSYSPAAVTGQEVTQSSNRLANQDIFMQLLVAQLRHQNPMNPADGVEFMTQLTQFSQLEQMMSVRKELESIRQMLEGFETAAGTQETFVP